MRSVHRVLLWRVALGVSVWRTAFVNVGSAYRRTMIGGARVVVKGGFSGICRRTQDGGIPAYAGMTGGGGNGGMRGGIRRDWWTRIGERKGAGAQ